MRILITSFDFAPSIGGIETAGTTLARGLAARGHDVTVVTATEGGTEPGDPFKVVRRPSPAALLNLVRGSDVVWQNHISLRFLWPLLIVRKPLVIMHHLVLATDVGSGPRYGALKRLACRLGQNAYVSEFLRKDARLPGPVLYNSYDAEVFRPMPEIARARDVVFLGRLQPYKGADILIDAVALLVRQGERVTATIIGGGPEASALKDRAAKLGVADRIDFTGPLRGEALAQKLNAHRVMAIPSRGHEALPITALEGIACGCVVIGTQSGGLPEAIGPCGPIVAQDDPAAMAEGVRALLNDAALYARYRDAAPAHLSRFTVDALIDAVETLIAKTIAR